MPVEKCLIQSETADKIAAVVREWMTEFSVMPYDYEKKRGTIRHIYVRVGEKSGESQLTLISATKKMPKLDVLVERLRAAAPSLTGILLNHNQRDDNVILGNRTDVLWGEPMLEDRLCGHTFLLSPEAFYQVNHAQAERLYACAVDYAGLTGEETVLDLYCGAGTITLALAEHAKTAIGGTQRRPSKRRRAQSGPATAWKTQSSSVRMRVRQRSGWPSAVLLCWWSIRRARVWMRLLSRRDSKMHAWSCDAQHFGNAARRCGGLQVAQAIRSRRHARRSVSSL